MKTGHSSNSKVRQLQQHGCKRLARPTPCHTSTLKPTFNQCHPPYVKPELNQLLWFERPQSHNLEDVGPPGLGAADMLKQPLYTPQQKSLAANNAIMIQIKQPCILKLLAISLGLHAKQMSLFCMRSLRLVIRRVRMQGCFIWIIYHGSICSTLMTS
jgi:hypothetical protein